MQIVNEVDVSEYRRYKCLELIRNNEIHHYHYDFLEPYRKF